MQLSSRGGGEAVEDAGGPAVAKCSSGHCWLQDPPSLQGALAGPHWKLTEKGREGGWEGGGLSRVQGGHTWTWLKWASLPFPPCPLQPWSRKRPPLAAPLAWGQEPPLPPSKQPSPPLGVLAGQTASARCEGPGRSKPTAFWNQQAGCRDPCEECFPRGISFQGPVKMDTPRNQHSRPGSPWGWADGLDGLLPPGEPALLLCLCSRASPAC